MRAEPKKWILKTNKTGSTSLKLIVTRHKRYIQTNKMGFSQHYLYKMISLIMSQPF